MLFQRIRGLLNGSAARPEAKRWRKILVIRGAGLCNVVGAVLAKEHKELEFPGI